MPDRRVYLHNFDPDWQARFAPICARQGWCVAEAPPADVVVLRVDAANDIAEALDTFIAASGLLHTPVVVAGGPDEPAAYQAAAAGPAQAYIPGDDPHKVLAAARMVLDTVHAYAAVNPLTGLPGSPALQREIAARLPQRGTLAVIHFDLDNFKPYNDIYGYQQGDEMILWLKQLIEQAVARRQPQHWFLAHLGGDDFFLTTAIPPAAVLGQEVVESFEQGKHRFFAEEHLRAGQFRALNRAGAADTFDLTSLTAIMVTNEAEDITHPGHIAAVLAELKAYAKTMSGSNFVPDRRRHHWVT